ncbi:MAG: DNA gyrase inhibitor YacG [Phycisphaerae bacterium]|nr:DNA gyrase inhibitor YacG [Phycisphaerae bacterium]
MEHRCPVCRKTVKTSVQGIPGAERFFPFCSRRCKLVDLGAWLDAEYKIVSKSQSEESAEPFDAGEPPSDDA